MAMMWTEDSKGTKNPITCEESELVDQLKDASYTIDDFKKEYGPSGTIRPLEKDRFACVWKNIYRYRHNKQRRFKWHNDETFKQKQMGYISKYLTKRYPDKKRGPKFKAESCSDQKNQNRSTSPGSSVASNSGSSSHPRSEISRQSPAYDPEDMDELEGESITSSVSLSSFAYDSKASLPRRPSLSPTTSYSRTRTVPYVFSASRSEPPSAQSSPSGSIMKLKPITHRPRPTRFPKPTPEITVTTSSITPTSNKRTAGLPNNAAHILNFNDN